MFRIRVFNDFADFTPHHASNQSPGSAQPLAQRPFPRKALAASGDTSGCHKLGWMVLLAPGGGRSAGRQEPSNPQDSPTPPKEMSLQSSHRAEVEEACLSGQANLCHMPSSIRRTWAQAFRTQWHHHVQPISRCVVAEAGGEARLRRTLPWVRAGTFHSSLFQTHPGFLLCFPLLFPSCRGPHVIRCFLFCLVLTPITTKSFKDQFTLFWMTSLPNRFCSERVGTHD